MGYLASIIVGPPFNDPAFRNALSAAIDRNDAGAGVERLRRAASLISPALRLARPAADGRRRADVAKKISEEAGYVLVGGKLHYPAGKETLKGPTAAMEGESGFAV